MSTNNIPYQTPNMLIVNTDTSKIAIWNPRSQKGIYNNGTYDASTVPAGTLLGRVSATGKLKALVSTAVDGSQLPVGVAMDDYAIDEGTDGTIFFYDMGDIVEGAIKLQGGDTLDTVVSGRRLRDHLAAQGIKLVSEAEQSAYDNS